MELLDHDITALPPKQKLNWVGKGFYIGEVLWIVFWVIAYVQEYYHINEQDVLVMLFLLFSYYIFFGIIYTFYGNVFGSKNERLFATLGFLAVSPAWVLFLLFIYNDFSVPQYLWLLILPATAMAAVSFLYFLIRLTNRNPLSSRWHYIAMLVRLGLYLVPLVMIIYVRLFVVGNNNF